MRSCQEAQELISAALDGALTDGERAALDKHLSRCPACSALFEELRGLKAACAELEDVPAPVGFSDRVMDAIAADPAQEKPDNTVPFPAPKRFRTPWKGWAASAAVVAVVVLGAVTLPGRLGANNTAASSGATADCAALFTEDEAAEAETYVSATSGDSGAARIGDAAEEPESAPADPAAGTGGNEKAAEYDVAGGAAEPESVFIDLTAGDAAEAEEQEETDAESPDSSPAPTAFCGTLTLTGEFLPDGLEEYKGTADSAGTVTYVVPADFFFSCLNTLEEKQPGNFTYELGPADAPSGRITVRASAGS